MSTLSQTIHHVDLDRLGALASELVKRLPAPIVIGLVGTLGAGKTKMVQLLVQAAAKGDAEVTSPTFTLVQSYQGSPQVHHLDAYRVNDEDEFMELGVDELFDDTQAWTIVEWANRMSRVMPKDTLWIELEIESDVNMRTITIRCSNEVTISIISEIIGRLDQLDGS